MATERVEIQELKIEDLPWSCTIIFIGPPGSGKCHSPGTPILMYDGTVKSVESIKKGEQLMGDNFEPRTVLETTKGRDEMFDVYQSEGMKYGVNLSHILTLYNTKSNKILDVPVQTYFKTPEIYRGVRIDEGKLKLTPINVVAVGKGDYYGFEIDGNGRYLLQDGTVTHNTSGMETIAYSLKHRYPVGRAFIGTESGYKKFCDIMHPLYVSNYYEEDEEKSHIRRQRLCALENGDEYPGNYALNIIDDVADVKVFKSKIFGNLFKLGSQHWHQLCMVGLQYAIDMTPGIRKNVSYVGLFREPDGVEREKLFKNFGGLAGNYKNFCDLMDQITGDYTCLVFKKRSQSNRLEDNVFWMKSQKLNSWKFGCKEYREWAEKRYNPDYVEEILMD